MTLGNGDRSVDICSSRPPACLHAARYLVWGGVSGEDRRLTFRFNRENDVLPNSSEGVL